MRASKFGRALFSSEKLSDIFAPHISPEVFGAERRARLSSLSDKRPETFSDHLWRRLDALGHISHDGDSETRRMIVGRYYAAYNKIEDRVTSKEIAESASHYFEVDGVKKEVKFYRIESSQAKALGIAVIAKLDDEIFGRMFIAHIPSKNKSFNHNHLSILSVEDGNEILQMEITSAMLATYFNVEKEDEREALISTRIARSCIGSYAPSLQKILNYNVPLCDSMILSVGELYRASRQTLTRQKTPAVDVSEFEAEFLEKKSNPLEIV